MLKANGRPFVTHRYRSRETKISNLAAQLFLYESSLNGEFLSSKKSLGWNAINIATSELDLVYGLRSLHPRITKYPELINFVKVTCDVFTIREPILIEHKIERSCIRTDHSRCRCYRSTIFQPCLYKRNVSTIGTNNVPRIFTVILEFVNRECIKECIPTFSPIISKQLNHYVSCLLRRKLINRAQVIFLSKSLPMRKTYHLILTEQSGHNFV